MPAGPFCCSDSIGRNAPPMRMDDDGLRGAGCGAERSVAVRGTGGSAAATCRDGVAPYRRCLLLGLVLWFQLEWKLPAGKWSTQNSVEFNCSSMSPFLLPLGGPKTEQQCRPALV